MITIPFQKVFGILLVIVGLAIIGYSLFQSWQVFTGQAMPPAVFEVQESIEEAVQDPGLEGQIDALLDEQLGKLLPADTIPQMLNLVAWSMLASLLFFGGAQVAGIGVKLFRS
jgi:hypothetical protein